MGDWNLESPETARRMALAISHRGPDDLGVWTDKEACVALSHARLAVFDPTPAGKQPMVSKCGRFVVSYNGEIYNFRGLREELKTHGFAFSTSSDTEVLLAAVAHWGFEGALRRFNGMFAIAVWDRRDRKLSLARDRMGEKPLYYRGKAPFIFASELKAIRTHPAFESELDREALALYLRLGYVPTPHSVYRGISKLPAASWLEVSVAGTSQPRSYWTPPAPDLHAPVASVRDSESQLEAHLTDAVRLRMASDVPLGAFLSGGVDSSTIVALMQESSARPIKTFTVGFQEPEYNEADDARKVAAHLGTDHTELLVTAEEARRFIPRIPSIYDEPFADSSQIPTCLLSAMTRRNVTVSLSGDGGDELFGGYTRYSIAPAVWKAMSWAPHAMRRTIAHLLRLPSPRQWDSLALLAPLISRYGRQGTFGDKFHKLAEILDMPDFEALYCRQMSLWERPELLIPGQLASWPPPSPVIGGSEAERMMRLDVMNYLPDDLLVKVDRASMSVGLESRAPFLDHRLVEFSWNLPVDQKIRRGVGKWLVRKLLYRRVPQALLDRPKMGFGVPIDAWLRGPLRSWAEDLLDEGRLRRQSLLEPGLIRQRWIEHLSGRRNWQHSLWAVLMLESWLDHWSQ